jgi:hypothetical protein
VQAPVEIRYEGAVLAKAVAPTGSLEEGGSLFLPLADPMPVGTRLELRTPSDTTLVRVVKVVESVDAAVAGMTVRPFGISEPIEVFEPDPPLAAPAPVAASAVAPAPVAPAARGTSTTANAASPPPPTPKPDAAAPVTAKVEPPTEPAAPGGNGAGRSSVAGTINNGALLSGVVEAPMEGGESVEVEDTTSTSEYPALANGAGRRRKKARKPPR